MKALNGVDSHPSADEIYDMVRRELPQISLGTVYRNLELLSEHGLIKKLEFSSSQRRFDGIIRNHYHLRCTGCGQIEDSGLEPIATLEEDLRKISDYDIVGHRLEFIGLCPKCKQKENSSKMGEN
jgi:Fur family ferric uptake transcriptional regulator